MAHDLKFGGLGQARGLGTAEGGGDRGGFRDVALREADAGAAGAAGFLDQLHKSASIALASALISSRVHFSVTATRIWFLRSG